MTLPSRSNGAQGEAGVTFVLNREATGLDKMDAEALAKVTHFVLECVPDDADPSVLVDAMPNVRDVTIGDIGVAALSLLSALPMNHPIRDVLKSLNPRRVCVTYPNSSQVKLLARQRHATVAMLKRRGLIPSSDDGDSDKDGAEDGDEDNGSDDKDEDESPFDDTSYEAVKYWIPLLVRRNIRDPLEANQLGWNEVQEVCLHNFPLRLMNLPEFKTKEMRVYANESICAEHGRFRRPERVADMDEHDDDFCMANRTDMWLIGLPQALANLPSSAEIKSLEIINPGGNLVWDCHCRESFTGNIRQLVSSIFRRTDRDTDRLEASGTDVILVKPEDADRCFCGRGTRLNVTEDDDAQEDDLQKCSNKHLWSIINPEHYTGDGTVGKDGEYEMERQIDNIAWLQKLGEGIAPELGMNMAAYSDSDDDNEGDRAVSELGTQMENTI